MPAEPANGGVDASSAVLVIGSFPDRLEGTHRAAGTTATGHDVQDGTLPDERSAWPGFLRLRRCRVLDRGAGG